MATRKALPSVDEIVANLTAVRRSATRAQVLEGRAWYPAMGAFIREIRDETCH